MPADVHHLKTEQTLDALNGLLQSLVPRANGFFIYDADRALVWSSERGEDPETDAFVADLTAATLAGAEPNARRRTLDSGRTALAVPVQERNGGPSGILVALFSRNAGKSSWFDAGLLTRMLGPAAGIVAELLGLIDSLRRAEAGQSSIDDELRLVYSLDRRLHGTSRRHSGLAELVGQSGRFLGIAYSVLLLPGKRIRISATHSSWKTVNRRAVDKYVVETLMPQLDGSAGPVVFDVAAIEGSEHPTDQGYQTLLSPLTGADGNLEGVIAQFGRVNGRPFDDSHKRFMAHIARKAEQVIEQSFDPLTGLMNRGGFEAQLKESGKTLDGSSEAHQLIYFDLDNLQLINDTFGREAGDEVLIRFSQILETALPRNAVATRITGDDFVMLMTHAKLDEALAVANGVRAQSGQLRYLEGSKSLQVTVSIGIAAFDGQNGEGDAMTAARIACDAAKDHGRDRIEIHDQDDQSIIRRYDDMQLITNIQQKLDEDDFTLLAQPIVLASDPSTEARYEILIRMNDSKGNPVSSSALISAAERYHMMPQVDRWVVSSTIRIISARADELADAGVSFAINLSGQSLGDDEMLAFIEDEIESASIPAGMLSFEVTESAAVSNMTKAQHFISKLRERGCRFSLDDFGAGLSSFAYLKNLDVDTLKIDGSFIRGIVDDRIAQSMVAAITEVARVMSLETVAEYVEDAETQQLITSLGVDYLQGHTFGLPAELSSVVDGIVEARKTA